MRRTNISSITKCVLVSIVLIYGTISTFAQTEPKRTISVSYTQVKGVHNKFYSEVVGAGRAAEGLRADWMRDLETVHRECGFKYIRFHGLLHDEMGVYSEDKNGKPIYNFQYVDALYDSILNIGMKPFVELAFMPEKLKSNDKTIFWWKGNISPPKDYEKWQNLIQALVKHWTARYGEEEVKQWYFEVWNEPNLDFFFSGTQAEYFKLYEHTAKAVKSVSPEYHVGGPATAGRAWITETIDFANKNKVSLDFITTHDYGVNGIGFDEDGNQKLFLVTDSNAIIGGVKDVNKQIKSSPMPNLPLHYTEWSSSYSPRDPVHDSYISAPYILSKLKGSAGYIDSMSYWTFTDIFEENGTVPNPFHGGFGMINFQGLRKPSFYAYQFLNRLGNEELTSNDAESWTTRSVNGVQILLWNFTPPKTDESDQVFYKKDLPATNFGKVNIKISDIPAGNYQLDLYQIGYQVNDVYTDYLKIGAPQNLKREQVKELNGKNNGQTSENLQIKIKPKQTFTKEINLRENDVFLITLTRIVKG
jgi:xylan 1,4-beta-xylosidase